MYNWAHSHKLASEDQIIQPIDSNDLKSIITDDDVSSIKCVGSGMSYLGIAALDSVDAKSHVLVNLNQISGLIGEISDNKATFGAGTLMQDVVDKLLAHNLQLTVCPGVLLTQTIGGALATGTHGQGLSSSGLCDSVYKITVILANGSTQEYIQDNNPDNPFYAFQIHLGALGILTQVTFKCEPMQIYRVDKDITFYQDLVSDFIHWNQSSIHCKAWWFPKTNHVQLWRTSLADDKECAFYKTNQSQLYHIKRDSSKDSGKDVSTPEHKHMAFSSSIDDLLVIMEKDTTESKPNNIPDLKETKETEVLKARYRTVTRFRNLESCIGNIYQIWCKGIPAPQINCELALPLENLNEALNALYDYYKNNPKIEMHYPFILRTTGASKAWLSPAYGKQVCFIGFLVYMSDDTENYKADEDRLSVLKDIEGILSNYGCLPHYGKFFTPKKYNFKNELPQWSKFLELRKILDPKGLFMNDYLRNLLE